MLRTRPLLKASALVLTEKGKKGLDQLARAGVDALEVHHYTAQGWTPEGLIEHGYAKLAPTFSPSTHRTKAGVKWVVVPGVDLPSGFLAVVHPVGREYLVGQYNERGEFRQATTGVRFPKFDLIEKVVEPEWFPGWTPGRHQGDVVRISNGVVKRTRRHSSHNPFYLMWAAEGNCFPGTPHGTALAEARRKYLPLVVKAMAGASESGRTLSDYMLLTESAPRPFHVDIRRALHWLDHSMTKTIEECEEAVK